MRKVAASKHWCHTHLLRSRAFSYISSNLHWHDHMQPCPVTHALGSASTGVPVGMRTGAPYLASPYSFVRLYGIFASTGARAGELVEA